MSSTDHDYIAKRRKEAERGEESGQAFLGLLYAEGDHGVEPDYAEACFWLTLAMNNKVNPKMHFIHPGMDYIRRLIYQDVSLTPEQITEYQQNLFETRERIIKKLTPEQVSAVKERVTNWKPKMDVHK